MPAISELESPASSTGILADGVRRKRFTRAEVRRMEQLGLLEGRYELIEGDLIDKMGQNPPHAFGISALLAWAVTIFGQHFVRIQLPLDVPDPDRERNEPQPDVAVLAQPFTEYQSRHPLGSELRLLIEVADTSLVLDRKFKARLYARAGVPEYWVLGIPNRVLYVHRHPVNGEYQQVIQLSDSESVAPECQKDALVSVRDLLPGA
jgi:Uma2 family endonuclease